MQHDTADKDENRRHGWMDEVASDYRSAWTGGVLHDVDRGTAERVVSHTIPTGPGGTLELEPVPPIPRTDPGDPDALGAPTPADVQELEGELMDGRLLWSRAPTAGVPTIGGETADRPEPAAFEPRSAVVLSFLPEGDARMVMRATVEEVRAHGVVLRDAEPDPDLSVGTPFTFLRFAPEDPDPPRLVGRALVPDGLSPDDPVHGVDVRVEAVDPPMDHR